nr:hypothetical protein [Tanacetum cinerariifolium]
EAKDVSADAKADQDAEVNENADIQGRTTESQVEIYKIDIDHANKTKEQINEEESRALKRINESLAEKAAKRQKLDKEVKELKRHLQIVPDDDDVYTEATPLARKVPLARKKNQRSVHGQAKVKSWKLLEYCGVQIITFTIIQLILLVERKYPLTKFTLNQMLNNVRLEVEEESKVSLELLSFEVNAAMDFKENMLSV